MGTVLWILVCCVEAGFLLWSLVTKERHAGEKEAVRIGGLLLGMLLLAVGVLQGVSRYGMFLGVLGLQIIVEALCIWRDAHKAGKEATGKGRRFSAGRTIAAALGNLVLYAFALIPAILFPQYEAPELTGSYAVKTTEYTWVDESRIETYTDTGENRTLTVKIWYPVCEEAEDENGRMDLQAHSCPLVVFSHGAFGVIDSNYSTCAELASHGYVVASIGHTYQSMYLKDTSGKVTIVNPDFMNQVYTGNGTRDPEVEKIVYENSREWIKIRSADENFVLDRILSLAAQSNETDGEPWELINSDKIGLFGHSMGGATSVQMGRERSDIDAVIDLEGTMLGEYVDFKDGTEVFNDEIYTVPVLDVNSSAVDEEARSLPGDGYVNFYLGERASDYHYEVIEGAGHLNFTDLPMVSPYLAKMLGTGEVDAKECIEQVNQMILDFFDTYLKG